jgi:hypothetical protein
VASKMVNSAQSDGILDVISAQHPRSHRGSLWLRIR